MKERIVITIAQMRLIVLACEHGYRQRENCETLETALASIHDMYVVLGGDGNEATR